MSTLSAVLTTYNCKNYLPRCIDSIVNQSRLPDEFIIMDDGSTDGSSELIKEYASKFNFIKFVQNEKNLGAIQAIDKLTDMPTKEYLFSIGADDYVKPGYLKKAMDLLDKYPQAALCTGDIELLDISGNSKGMINLGFSDTPSFLSPLELVDRVLGFPIFGHCTVYNYNKFVEVGKFIPELKWHSDWFINLVLAAKYGICYVPETVVGATDNRPGGYCAEGSKNWQQESDIIVHAVNLLKTKFRDALPFFIRTAAFTVYAQAAAKAFMTRQEIWDPESLLLMQMPLFNWNNQTHQSRLQRSRQVRRSPVST